MQRARDLVPALRERAAAAERIRQPPEATRLDLRAAGLHRIFQPARFGGSESPFRAGVDILAAVGQGCGSTAWVLVQNMTHNLMLAHWSDEAQRDIWGDTPDILVSGILIPGVGRAHRVAGGYRLSGRWPFVSGVNICDWALFTAMVPNAAGFTEDRHFVVPRHDFTILDTWHAVGLRASASNDVVVEDIFIPEHRAVTSEDLKGGGVSPGSRHNTAAIYRAPCYAMFGLYIAAAALGIAEAAVQAYIEGARRRVARMTGAGVAGLATQHVRIAEAAASVETARLLLYAISDTAMAAAEAGASPSPEERTRWRCQAAFAGKLVTNAVNLVWEAGGGGNVYDENPVSRAFRDAQTANRHTTQTWDLNAATHGRVLFGLPLDNPAL